MRVCIERCAGGRTHNQHITGSPGTPALFHIHEEESPDTLPGDGPGRQAWSVALRLHSPCRAHHRGVWAAQPREKSEDPATLPPLQRPELRSGGTRAPRRELSSSLPLRRSPSCPLRCLDVPAAGQALAQDGAAAVAPLLPPVRPPSASARCSPPIIRHVLLQATASPADARSQPGAFHAPPLIASSSQAVLPAVLPLSWAPTASCPPGTVPAMIARFPLVRLQQHGASTPRDSLGPAR